MKNQRTAFIARSRGGLYLEAAGSRCAGAAAAAGRAGSSGGQDSGGPRRWPASGAG